MAGKPINVKVLTKQLEGYGGNVSLTASSMGCSRQAIYDIMEKNPEVGQVLIDARERMVDRAENVLANQLDEGSLVAAIYITKTLGKKRGYSERHEHTGPNSGPIPITFNLNPKIETDEAQ